MKNMISKRDFIDVYGGNGFKFDVDGDNRPKIQDMNDTIQIHTSNGTFEVSKNEIDDVVKLLVSARCQGYNITG